MRTRHDPWKPKTRPVRLEESTEVAGDFAYDDIAVGIIFDLGEGALVPGKQNRTHVVM